jgi:hypothetical protein
MIFRNNNKQVAFDVKVELEEMGCDGVGWINLAQDTV